MVIPAGAPGFWVLSGSAGGMELLPCSYIKNSWSVPFSNPNCLWTSRSIPAKCPSPKPESRSPEMKEMEIGK